MTASSARGLYNKKWMRWNVRQRDESRRNTIIELETHFGVRGACVRSRVVQFIASRCDLMFIRFFLLIYLLTRRNDFMVWCTPSFDRISSVVSLHEPYAYQMRNTRHPNTCSTQWPCFITCIQSPASRSACGRANFLDGHVFHAIELFTFFFISVFAG